MLWLFPLLFVGCSADGGPGSIEAGDYQFFTLAVHDGCLDGALEALFMPEGPGSRHAFEYAIYVPSAQETPLDYAVDFREPFMGMPVTVEATEAGLEVRGSVMDLVLLDESQYGDCVTTMSVDVDLSWAAVGVLDGDAVIDVSDPRGSENRCPVFDQDPCEVLLTIEAEREGDGSPE